MVLLFFMDGVKYDMMQKHMPFLASINSIPLISDFGYSCACHATMYTSRYVEEHGTWFIWKKGNNSPYKWINYIPGLKYINFLPLKLMIGKVTRKLSKNSSYSGVSCLVNLPLKYWDLFEPCDNVMWDNPEWKKEIPNLFTILKNEEIKHQTIALHKNTKENDAFVEEKNANYKENKFIYYFIGYTDNIMHQHGEDEAAQKYFAKADQFIKDVYDKAKQENENVTLLAFSDHGHITIEGEMIDINNYFKQFHDNVNNYIHLIESNFARFWFRNDSEKKQVENVLIEMEKQKLGFILTKDILNQYHLNVNPKEHGELIFYLAAPREFTKTIWGFGHSVKSGHGYEPILPKHYGIFCSNKSIKENKDFAYLVDILPTVMAELKISPRKYFVRGNNLLKVEDNCEKK